MPTLCKKIQNLKAKAFFCSKVLRQHSCQRRASNTNTYTIQTLTCHITAHQCCQSSPSALTTAFTTTSGTGFGPGSGGTYSFATFGKALGRSHEIKDNVAHQGGWLGGGRVVLSGGGQEEAPRSAQQRPRCRLQGAPATSHAFSLQPLL